MQNRQQLSPGPEQDNYKDTKVYYINGSQFPVEKVHINAEIARQQYNILSLLQNQNINNKEAYVPKIHFRTVDRAISMEYIDGSVLEKCNEFGIFIDTNKVRCSLIRGIQYLHNRNVIHGNLSCDNIIVTNNSTCVFVGFSGAAIMNEEGIHFRDHVLSVSEDYKALSKIFEWLNQQDYGCREDIPITGSIIINKQLEKQCRSENPDSKKIYQLVASLQQAIQITLNGSIKSELGENLWQDKLGFLKDYVKRLQLIHKYILQSFEIFQQLQIQQLYYLIIQHYHCLIQYIDDNLIEITPKTPNVKQLKEEVKQKFTLFKQKFNKWKCAQQLLRDYPQHSLKISDRKKYLELYSKFVDLEIRDLQDKFIQLPMFSSYLTTMILTEYYDLTNICSRYSKFGELRTKLKSTQKGTLSLYKDVQHPFLKSCIRSLFKQKKKLGERF